MRGLFRRITLCVALIVAGAVEAQSKGAQSVDSLIRVLETQTSDAARIKTLDQLAFLTMYNNPERGIGYAKKALDLSLTLEDKPLLEDIYDKISVGNYLLGNYASSMDACRRSLSIHEQKGDSIGIQNNYNSMGALFNAVGNHEKALEYFDLSLKMAEALRLANESRLLHVNISEILLDEEELDSAKSHIVKALEISINSQSEIGIGESYFSLADYFSEIKEYDSALIYGHKALEIHQVAKRRAFMANTHALLSAIYFNRDMLDSSSIHADRGLILAQEIPHPSIMKELYHILSSIYERQNKSDKALEYHKKYFALHDSLSQEMVREQIVMMEAEYALNKKNDQINQMLKEDEIQELRLQKKNLLLYVLLGSFLLLLVLGVVLYNNYRLSKESKILALQSKLLRSQMNPHFIFNSLMAIQSFALERESREVEKYLSKFANLMRLILKNSRVEMINLEKELEVLDDYVELQMLRYENKFRYALEVDGVITLPVVMIPPMLIQPFVENAIEHGLARKKSDGELTIRIRKKGAFLLIEVIDNGVGIDIKKSMLTDAKSHISLATKIIKDRLAVFNRNSKAKASLEIGPAYTIDGQEKGTRVALKFPLIKERF